MQTLTRNDVFFLFQYIHIYQAKLLCLVSFGVQRDTELCTEDVINHMYICLIYIKAVSIVLIIE